MLLISSDLLKIAANRWIRTNEARKNNAVTPFTGEPLFLLTVSSSTNKSPLKNQNIL
jgi:hypothetical protein